MTEVVPLESAIVKRIERWLKSQSYWYLKTQPPNRPGVPDLLVCARGRFIGIEVKRPRVGVVSRVQRYEGSKIKRAGGQWIVATCLVDVEQAIGAA